MHPPVDMTLAILLAVVTLLVGIGAIVNAVRVNKEKHGEGHGDRARHGHAIS